MKTAESQDTSNMKNLPQKIYLNIGTDQSDDFKELSQVTWSQERISKDCIEYVLTDKPKSTGLSLQECKEPVMKTLDEANGRCSSCGGRTALVLGQWVYRVDGEPYQSGRYEESESQGGTKWLHGFKCDDCEQIQGIWSE